MVRLVREEPHSRPAAVPSPHAERGIAKRRGEVVSLPPSPRSAVSGERILTTETAEIAEGFTAQPAFGRAYGTPRKKWTG